MAVAELPTAYAEGYAEFFGRRFSVDPRVLIPRLDTETLVRLARREIDALRPGAVVDVGTGSGIVGLTLALERAGCGARFHATDASLDALEVAQANRAELGADCDLWQGDLLEPILSAGAAFDAGEGPILLVSNLPYVPEGDPRVGADVAAWEPALALYGGPVTGWELYARFFDQARDLARAFPGRAVVAWIEQGEGQETAAREGLAALGLTPEFFPDLSGVPRFVRVAVAG